MEDTNHTQALIIIKDIIGIHFTILIIYYHLIQEDTHHTDIDIDHIITTKEDMVILFQKIMTGPSQIDQEFIVSHIIHLTPNSSTYLSLKDSGIKIIIILNIITIWFKKISNKIILINLSKTKMIESILYYIN